MEEDCKLTDCPSKNPLNSEHISITKIYNKLMDLGLFGKHGPLAACFVEMKASGPEKGTAQTRCHNLAAKNVRETMKTLDRVRISNLVLSIVSGLYGANGHPVQ